MALLNFDASKVQPDQGRQEAIPAGWYNVMMVKSELKPTKAGDGAFLESEYKVLDGQFAGHSLYGRVNLQNLNQQAVEIGLRQLSAIAHAVGVMFVQDSALLHDKPLKVKAKYRAAEGQYEATNDITAYKNINEQTSAPVAAPAVTAFQPPAAPAAAPPVGWTPPGAPAQAPAAAWQPPVTAQPAAAPTPPWGQPPAGQPAAPAQPWSAPAQVAAPPPVAPPAAVAAQSATPPWQRPAG